MKFSPRKAVPSIVVLTIVLLLLPYSVRGQFSTVSFEKSEESIRDLPRPTPKFPQPQEVEGEWVMISKPKFVQAGFFPEFIGNHFANSEERYPVVSALAKDDQLIAKTLSRTSGLADPLNDFLPGHVNFLEGVPLAMVFDDLEKSGFDTDKPGDVKTGLLAIFHIQLSVPGHEVDFPKKAQLHFKYIDHDLDVVINAKADMTARSSGDYYFANFQEVRQLFDKIYREIPRQQVAWGIGRELKFVKFSGFDESTIAVEDLPKIEGVVLTHELRLGTWGAISGWQWFGRPEGLIQSQQIGFVQP